MNIASLRGSGRLLTLPSTLTVLVGVGVVTVYLVGVLRVPPGSGWALVLIIALVSAFFVGFGWSYEQRQLAPLVDLANGRIEPTPRALGEAARSLARAPDVSFWLSVMLIGCGAVATAALWWLVSSVPFSTVLRVGFTGVAIAPLTAVLGHLVLLPRTRAVLAALMEGGLPLEALPRVRAGRLELLRRLVTYAAIAMVTPALLIVDATIAGVPLGAAAPSPGLWPAVWLGALVTAMVGAGAWLAGTALGEPLRRLARRTDGLAKGRYGDTTPIAAEYEALDAAIAVTSMERNLLAALRQLGEATVGIEGATTDLRGGVDLHRAGADQQTAALTATAATTEELARSARQIAGNAQTVSELAQRTLDAARRGKASAGAFTAAMKQVRAGNQAVADSVVRLNKRVQQVGKVVEFIDGIADRSDLLAVNAELEGNKAGEVGRGFSLVAAEMRRLAESVMASTREISRLIDDIRDATNAAVMATEAGVKATDAGTERAQQVSDGLARIVDFAHLAADAVQSISTATVQQQGGTDQLVRAMEDILESTRSGVAASNEMAEANLQLEGLSRDLAASVQRFKGAA